MLLALVLFFTSMDLYAYLADFHFSLDERKLGEDVFKRLVLAYGVLIFLWLWLRYRNKERVNAILEMYKDETRILRILRISLFWLYVIGIFAIFFLLVEIKHSN